jgi:hypothetical protein
VKIAGFIRIGRKLRICTEIYAAVDQSFMELASGLQRFQLVNSMQDFLGPHHYEGRVGQSQSRLVLRARKFTRQPEEPMPEFA